MLVQHTQFDGPTLELFAKAETASRAIPPLWSLAQTVAVNPFLGQTSEPLVMTAARMDKVAGIAVTQPRADLLAKVDAGEISYEDLATALQDAGGALPRDVSAFLARARSTPTAMPQALPTVADLAAHVSGVDWPRLVEDRIGQWAAGHFDAGQALWPAPKLAPFGAWYAYARRDITPELNGLTGFAARVAALPNTAPIAMAYAAETLDVSPACADMYFHRLLMTLGGWAQLARKDAWVAEQAGERDTSVTDLLSIRMVWEAALLDRYRTEIGALWTEALDAYAQDLTPTEAQHIDCLLQAAAEIAGQRRLAAGLGGVTADPSTDRPTVQAAFCIDVRSEVFRRALEAQDASVETIGFAGFFGLAISHGAAASDIIEDRAPVLLSPGLTSASGHAAEADADLRLSARAKRAWGRFSAGRRRLLCLC